MKAKSDNLRKAKAAKNDEFYTRLEDIEAEISSHPDYVRQFQGKTVLCPCDDPEWSNFFVFFKNHFKQLGINKLITTHYNADGSLSYKIEWDGEMLNDDMVNLIKTPLKENGDFRSDEVKEIMKLYGENLVVVTNPPFSEYRTFIAQLEEYGCKYIVIGNKNSIAYKEIFPLLKDGKMFVGYNAGNGTMHFATTHTDAGIGPITNSVPSYWFTNFDIDKTHEPIPLTKNYKGNEDKYPRYDNYDAIECGKVSDIPKDYEPCWYKCPHAAACEYAKTEGQTDNALCEQSCNGEIGVPLTYLSSHCKDQFDVLGSSLDLAAPIKDCVHEDDTFDKGGPTFYLPDEKGCSQFVHVERERERERELRTASQTAVSQSCHQEEDVTASSESRLPSCHPIVVNNSVSLDSIDIPCQKNVLSAEDSQLTKYPNTPEFLFKKCNGIIGVPITYLSHHCAEQFIIIGKSDTVECPIVINNKLKKNPGRFYIDDKRMYDRIIIQRINNKNEV